MSFWWIDPSWLCMGFSHGFNCKESACNMGDPGSIPESGNPLKEEMATHSSILTWTIPWTEEPSRLQSMGWQRVRYDWGTDTHDQLRRLLLSLLINFALRSILSDGASLVAQLVKNPPAMQETPVQFLGREDPLEKGSTHYSLQYSGLENSIDYTAKSQTRLSDFQFLWYYAHYL